MSLIPFTTSLPLGTTLKGRVHVRPPSFRKSTGKALVAPQKGPRRAPVEDSSGLLPMEGRKRKAGGRGSLRLLFLFRWIRLFLNDME